MTGPDIASLRARVVLQSPLEADDGAGGVVVTWTSVATLWAAIAPRSMREAAVAGHLDEIVTHRVSLRFRDDVRGGWRMLEGARVLRVLAARDPDGRRRVTECLCEEAGR